MDSQARCKNCRWWEQPETPGTWGACLLTFIRYGTEDQPKSLALAYAYDDGNAQAIERTELATAPDFGCIQFEVSDE